MDKATRKRLEEIISNYHNYPKQIKEREDHLLNPHIEEERNVGGGRSNQTGSPTESDALRLINDECRQDLQNNYNAVTIALSQSDKETKEIIKLWYMGQERLTWWQVAARVGYSRNQSIRKRDDFLVRLHRIIKSVP